MSTLPTDPNKRLAAIGGGLLIVSAFLPWATIDVLETSMSSNGLTGMGYSAPLAGCVALWMVYFREWRPYEAKVTAAAGALSLVSLGIVYSSLENVFAVGQPANHVSVSPEIGLYVAVLAGGLVTLGGYRGLQAFGSGSTAVSSDTATPSTPTTATSSSQSAQTSPSTGSTATDQSVGTTSTSGPETVTASPQSGPPTNDTTSGQGHSSPEPSATQSDAR
ncbi:hypothetical protein OB919_11420 [Halobacteria archaeon AArc-curdl1]|uniref:Uncharacterized protein n=1 Tax=Natronosalvus hydrolyticus TaxID=2979988 RepID=A0AAP3E6E0_9EURY|nr:hypothetical protein [Halobacteria archaeon AArc-curdl1]